MANLLQKFNEMQQKVESHMQHISYEMEQFAVHLRLSQIQDVYLGPQEPKKNKRNISTTSPVEKISFANVVKKPLWADDDERKPYQVLGKIPHHPKLEIGTTYKPIIKDDESLYKVQDWLVAVNWLRTTSFSDFKEMYPHDRDVVGICCKGICFPGTPPPLVYKFFCLGLIRCIYPSQDLREISHFPKNLLTAIQRFAEKTQVTQMFIQVISTIPDWDDKTGKMVFPFNLIKIGSTKQPPTFTESAVQEEEKDVLNYQIHSLIDIKKEMEKITKQKNIKINYNTPRILVYSMFKKPASKGELKIIEKWRNQIETIEEQYSSRLSSSFKELTDPYGFEKEDSNILSIEDMMDSKEEKDEEMIG